MIDNPNEAEKDVIELLMGLRVAGNLDTAQFLQ